MSTMSLSSIVRPPSFANSWISWTRFTNSWNGLFASHGSDNFERFPTRFWFSTCPYYVKRRVTMSLTWRWVNPQLKSNTPERNTFPTASAICFFPARSRFIHSLNSLAASACSRWSFPNVALFVPDGMISWPGSGGMTNKVPGATIA